MALTKVKAGNILLTTPGASSNDVTPATTAYVTTALANLADSAPSTLDTLNELAAALGDDANFSTTVTNSIAAKLPLAGGTLTGVLTGTEFNVGVNYAGKFNAKQSGADAYGIVLEASGTDAWLRMGHTGTYAQIDATYNSSAGHTPLQLLAGGSARIHIATDGNVGIGTTSPTGSGTVLHVNGSSTVADFHLTNSTSGAASTDGFVLRYSGLNAEFLNREAGSNIFYTSGTEKMRIDSSGNVVIPTAFTTAGTGILFRDGITAASSKYNLSILSHDHSGDGNADGLTINGYDGVSFSTGTSTRTERMRLDSSGNLMIGGTNPAPVSNNVAGISLRAVNGEIQASVNGAPALYLNRLNNDGALAYFRKDGTTCGSIATKSGSNGGNNTIVVACQNTGLRFDDPNDAIYPTDDAGILVNNTIDLGQSGAAFNEFYTSKIYLNVAGANNGAPEAMNVYCAGGGGGYGINIKCIGTGGGTMLRFNTAGNIVGQIYTSSSATTYATSSDYRLKENVDYTWDATTRLKQLKPARFNFIVDDTNTLVDGFLAHEVQGIVPEAIKGEKDGDEMQCIDHSKLVPLLTKAIQEQQTLIESLTARIATLEE